MELKKNKTKNDKLKKYRYILTFRTKEKPIEVVVANYCKVCVAIFCIAGVFVSAVAQILLKKSAGKTYESKIREYLNPYVIISYAIFFGATFCTIYAYKGIPLSMGPILAALEYIFVAILSRLVLKEHISLKKFIGLSLIIAGIIVYSL